MKPVMQPRRDGNQRGGQPQNENHAYQQFPAGRNGRSACRSCLHAGGHEASPVQQLQALFVRPPVPGCDSKWVRKSLTGLRTGKSPAPAERISAPRSAGFPACGFWRLSSRQLSPTFNRTRSGPIGAEGMKRDSLQTDAPPPPPSPKLLLRESGGTGSLTRRMRLWWNWQTRYFEVVVGQPVQVQVLLSAPF